MTPAQRTLRARLAAYAQHAQGRTSTRAGTTAFMQRFERDVDPDGVLDPAERHRRAQLARRAHMTRLALKSSLARTKKGGPDVTRAAQEDSRSDAASVAA